MAETWVSPKINWTSEDRFNISDFNRIFNNILWLYGKAKEFYMNVPIENISGQGEIDSFDGYWDAESFNKFENNIEHINQSIFTKDYGDKKHFMPNGPFITWDELNRIEGAILSMKEVLEAQERFRCRIPFNLGNQKGIRI